MLAASRVEIEILFPLKNIFQKFFEWNKKKEIKTRGQCQVIQSKVLNLIKIKKDPNRSDKWGNNS